MNPQNSLANREIVSSRVINAPQEKVFEAFRNPELLARWWGPSGFTNTFQTFDFQPGGVWEFVMHGPDGVNHPNKSIFVEIAAPEKVVFDHVVPPNFRMTITVEKVEQNKTRFSFRMQFETEELCEKLKDFCIPANEQNFDRLETLLALL